MNNNPSRILGIDPGKKRIGLAIGDDQFKIATAYKTITFGGIRNFIESLGTIVEAEGIKLIVMGLEFGNTHMEM